MRKLAALFTLFQLVLLGSPALAQDYYGGTRTVLTESWVEEWDAETGQWVRVSGVAAEQTETLPTVKQTYVDGRLVEETHVAARYAQPVAARGDAAMLAQYGPFVVTGPDRAAMVGSTDAYSPAQFDAMLRDFPGIERLDMIEAPGTSNDIANLAVARRIRASGIATHVPSGGSVRSGAVELFLAGEGRTMEDGAMFAVHSWLDNHGREADDFPPDHPAHRLYIDFYVEMGMSEAQARDFYAMTNSVPHAEALWLRAADMRPWLRPELAAAYRLAASEAAPVAVRTPAILPVFDFGFEAAPVAPDMPAIDYRDLSLVTLARLGGDAAPSALTHS